jgi:CheY-like chemotaxis protein
MNRNLPSILVVDDEPGVRATLEEVLELDGHSVVIAADGREGCQVLERTPSVGLVLIDLVMPNQEGIETIKQIRQTHPHVGIIAMSGAFGGQCLDVARYLGADATLAKPIDMRRLRETAIVLLQRDTRA